MGKLSWRAILGLGLGVWLIASPWVLGFAESEPAGMWTTLLAGITLCALSLIELDAADPLVYWLVLALGVVLVVAPFVLGYYGHVPALVNHIVVAAVVAVIAVLSLRNIRGQRRSRASS
jgi:hypothetical protein